MTKPRISFSQVQSYRGCEQAYDYHYRQHLVPKRIERPLTVGTWGHSLMEAFYKGEDWKAWHAERTREYERYDEETKFALDKGKSQRKSMERSDYEPLPSQVQRIFDSYLWYYRKRHEETLAVEVKFELDTPDYTLVGVIDRVYRDLDTGLVWVQEHKWWDEVPDESLFHTIDPQTTIYFPAAQEVLGVQAAGVEFNYVKSSPPGFPELTTKGAISERPVATDFPTLFRWLKANGFDPREYKHLLEPLAATSPFLRRYRMPRHELVTDRIRADFDRTAHQILGGESPIRNITRGCNWCSYAALCRAELFGVDTTYMRNQQFMTEAELDKARAKRERKAVPA